MEVLFRDLEEPENISFLTPHFFIRQDLGLTSTKIRFFITNKKNTMESTEKLYDKLTIPEYFQIK